MGLEDERGRGGGGDPIVKSKAAMSLPLRVEKDSVLDKRVSWVYSQNRSHVKMKILNNVFEDAGITKVWHCYKVLIQ